MRPRLPVVVSFIFSLLISSSALADLSAQREMFLLAEKALKTNDLKSFKDLQSQLTQYPLYPYLEYQKLNQFLSGQSAKTIQDFLSAHADTPLANRLRSKWLQNLARRDQWQTFLDFYQAGLSERIDCLHLQALHNTDQSKQAYAATANMWLHGHSRDKKCDKPFAQWEKAGLKNNSLVWQRIHLAINAGQIKLANYLKKSLPEKDRLLVDEWLNVRRHPEKTSNDAISNNHPYRQEALADGIIRLSRKDLDKALQQWEKLKNHPVYEPALIAEVERVIALQFLDQESLGKFDYLLFAEPCEQDSKLQEIRLRAALLHGQWQEVLHWLDRLPEHEKSKDRWQYWRARGLQETGKQEAALEVFKKVATERSFYGFMAADLLNLDYALNHRDMQVESDLYEQLKQWPAVLRAGEFLKLDRRLEARREWYFMTQNLDDDELIGLAQIAHEWQWHDRAIFTLAQAKSWDNLSIRFPTQYQDLVETQAKATQLDASWIFAMMRQESAFMHDARSAVGAVGLMQLMPRTAKSVAKSLKQKRPGYKDLIKPERNIQLGSSYLKQVYEELGNHPVLAIAAYNAGPHKVKKWLPENGSMPADIWIELIPYKETRRYVKSVLAYTVIYAEKLDQTTFKLKQRMPDVQENIEKIRLTSGNQADKPHS